MCDTPLNSSTLFASLVSAIWHSANIQMKIFALKLHLLDLHVTSINAWIEQSFAKLEPKNGAELEMRWDIGCEVNVDMEHT